MSKVFYAVLFTVLTAMGAMAQESTSISSTNAPEEHESQILFPFHEERPWGMLIYEYRGGFEDGPSYATRDACKISADFIVKTSYANSHTKVYCSNSLTGEALLIELNR